jgi:hypothetical protein
MDLVGVVVVMVWVILADVVISIVNMIKNVLIVCMDIRI